MKIGTKECKEAIVQWCKDNKESIYADFCNELTEEEYSQCLDVKNWKRRGKERDGASVIRDFDCTPFDDQLRAYVTEVNNVITECFAQGE